MALEGLLESFRSDLTARLSAKSARAEEVSAALAAYVAAHEREIANAFAAKNGLPVVAAEVDVDAAAVRLREAVAALPELAAATVPPPAPSVSPVRRGSGEVLTTVEAQRRLAAEFDEVNFAAVSLEAFLLFGDEFAAAARALQERTGGDPISSRVIRRLTALVHERELPRRIYGLSRVHRADWELLAGEARERRLTWSAKPAGGSL